MNGPREVQESHGWMKSENLKNTVVEVRSLKNSRHFWVVLIVYGHDRTNIGASVMNSVCVH